MVFEYVIGEHSISITASYGRPCPHECDKDAHTGKGMPLKNLDAIRRVCRQFYAETTTMNRYNHNVFYFDHPHYLRIWINHQGVSVLDAVYNLHIKHYKIGNDVLKDNIFTFKGIFSNLKRVDVDRLCNHQLIMLPWLRIRSDDAFHQAQFIAETREGESKKLEVVSHPCKRCLNTRPRLSRVRTMHPLDYGRVHASR
jgi:hypothetical protein